MAILVIVFGLVGQPFIVRVPAPSMDACWVTAQALAASVAARPGAMNVSCLLVTPAEAKSPDDIGV
jgi:hypothetical protein